MANIVLEGACLSITSKGLFSTKAVSISLDSLRLIYLFLPETFKWRVVQTNVQYRYINLETLSDESYSEISNLLLQQDSYSLGNTHIVLKDFSGQEVSTSFKALASNRIDLLSELTQYRIIRGEKLGIWLLGNPQVKFARPPMIGAGYIISVSGIGTSDKGYWIPWDALEKFTIFSTRSSTIFTFIPTKASKIGKFGAAFPLEQTHSWLAEFEFWRTLARPKAERVTD